jgi:AraC-like DNA-binding protein
MKTVLTEKEYSETWLQNALPLLEELFDLVPNIVFFAKDNHGRYIGANRTLAKRCGFSYTRELIGKTAADIFPQSMGAGYLAQDLGLIKSARKISDKLELHLYSSGRRGWCLTSKIPILNAEHNVIGLIGISQDLRDPHCGINHYEEISTAVEYIQQHYGETLSISLLAGLTGLSLYQFEKRMKWIFQITVGRFIIKTRIDASCELLARTSKSIVDIAIECGYFDQSAFTRQFKSITGLTPSGYRTARQNKGHGH